MDTINTTFRKLDAEMRESLKTMQANIRTLANVERSKISESEDKFAHIRYVRLEHTIRELLTRKSSRD